MPGDHKLRLHIEYDVLYVADLRKIVRTFENAYNILQRGEEPKGRMRRADRLTVQAARTGNSLTLLVLGGIGLAKLAILFGTRELFWKSEKTKWEAKGAKLDYEEKVRQVKEEQIAQVLEALGREDGPEARAVKLIERVLTMVDKSKEITSIEVEIDGQDTDPHKPSPIIKPAGPRKQLGPLTIRTGRRFR
jgi:hypothetical protein